MLVWEAGQNQEETVGGRKGADSREKHVCRIYRSSAEMLNFWKGLEPQELRVACHPGIRTKGHSKALGAFRR